jgi:hypothetical protein
MKLTYRGTPYELNPPTVDMAEVIATGRYRGAVCTYYHYPRHIPVAQSTVPLTLMYRGVAYSPDGTAPKPQVRPAAGMVSVRAASPQENRPPAIEPTSAPIPAAFQARQSLLRRVEKVHQENIRKLAERRLAAAQASGDQNLIQILQTELHQFA